MNITKDQWTQIVRAILIAALAIASILGYDIAIVQPREAAITTLADPLTRGITHYTELEADTVKAAAPTAVGTATPAMMVDSLGVSRLFEIRDAATPVWYVADGGAVTGTGALSAASLTGTGALTGSSAVIGGGFGSTGCTISTAGVLQCDGAATLGSTLHVTTSVTSADGTFTDDVNITDDLIGTGLINWAANEEHIGLPSVISTTLTYTPASGTIATVGASELWIVHGVYANVTTNWDTGGTNDATLNIGDGGDADGLLDLDDAELQTADTEGTGAPAGWQGFMSTDTRGAYLAAGHGFPYPATDTIDYACGGTALDAGAATIYVFYTRVY